MKMTFAQNLAAPCRSYALRLGLESRIQIWREPWLAP
jgi:hypothetical protein